MDTTLVDFNDMKWDHGDISFIFNGEAKPGKSLTVLDNKQKVYQRIRYEVDLHYSQTFYWYYYTVHHSIKILKTYDEKNTYHQLTD